MLLKATDITKMLHQMLLCYIQITSIRTTATTLWQYSNLQQMLV